MLSLHKSVIVGPPMLAALVTGGCLFASPASADLILDGGFESPSIPANSFQAVTPTSWSGGVLLFNGTVIQAGTTWPSPEEGNQFENIGNTGTSLSQTISVTTGGNYVLSWHDNTGESGGLTGSPYRATMLDSLLNTVASQSFDAYLAGVDNWQQKTLDMSLSPGTYDLTFLAEGVPNGLDTLIDNVSLTPNSVNSVPEPSSLAVFGAGLLGFVARRRRKTKNR